MDDIRDILKKVVDEAFDEAFEETLDEIKSESSIHLASVGAKTSVEISGHSAPLMVLLESGASKVIEEIANKSYGGNKKWLFEMFVDGVRKHLNL